MDAAHTLMSGIQPSNLSIDGLETTSWPIRFPNGLSKMTSEPPCRGKSLKILRRGHEGSGSVRFIQGIGVYCFLMLPNIKLIPSTGEFREVDDHNHQWIFQVE